MPDNTFKILYSLIIGILLFTNLCAQSAQSDIPEKDSLSWYIQMKYGLDQELINGFQYYKRYVKYKGDPFFPDDQFYSGSVSLKGVSYHDVLLKYNCYTQNLILGYTDYNNQYNQLIINSIHVDSFRLGSYRFKNMALVDQVPLFYQFLEAGQVSCYIQWKRDIHTTHDDLRYSHEYTKPSGMYYLCYKDKIHPFTSRKSFISILPVSLQSETKRYLRQHGIRFNQVSPGEIQNILNYISNLLETSNRP